jgi:hypothetical protein
MYHWLGSPWCVSDWNNNKTKQNSSGVYDGEGKDILCWLNVVYTVISNRTSKKKNPNKLCNNSVQITINIFINSTGNKNTNNEYIFIFSSPCQRQCELLPSLGVRRLSSVNFSHFNLLL